MYARQGDEDGEDNGEGGGVRHGGSGVRQKRSAARGVLARARLCRLFTIAAAPRNWASDDDDPSC